MIGLNDVVQIFDLSMDRILRAFALGFERGDGRTVGESLVGIDF